MPPPSLAWAVLLTFGNHFLPPFSCSYPQEIRPIGDVAQLGERGVRNAEVEGSIPFVSIFLFFFAFSFRYSLLT